jgi:hypothetical protein
MGPSYLTLNKAIIGCTLCSRTVIKSCDCSVWWGSLGSADYICKPQNHLIAFSFCPVCGRVHEMFLVSVTRSQTQRMRVWYCAACLGQWSNSGMKANRETDGNLERILLQWHVFLQNLTNNRQILNLEPQVSWQEPTANSLISSMTLSTYKKYTKTNKLRGLSPRANYTDRATAACRRTQC